ncbi:hypothetical protein ACFVX6_13915 [Streptomyces sp. NPDC058289]|uniref:hypothetical protein n=1 Tax=Streptomyces sp. NPDC058289 TaxID=3346425 RepID=UPI0036E65D5F
MPRHVHAALTVEAVPWLRPCRASEMEWVYGSFSHGLRYGIVHVPEEVQLIWV